ncbi:zinc metalloprotease [Bacteroidia bacterium]|nr:zinc metalloprotease [Bacteroidia bacterium]
MDIFIQVAQFVISLSLLVLVHECGHFLFARLFKVRVDKFYLFFNPRRSLVRAKRFAGKWHFSWLSPAPPKEWKEHPDNTEWGIGWLPVGGYCKISGMIDESMDKEQMKQPPQVWEFRSQAAWKRLLIIVGGVLFNFVSAVLIYAMILFVWGKEYLPIQNVTNGYNYCQVAKDAGFEDGDKILRVADFEPLTMGEAVEKVILSDGETVTVLRGNNTVQIQLPADFSQQILAQRVSRFAQERVPFVVQSVLPNSPAEAAGLQAGDSIVGFNEQHCPYYAELTEQLQNHAGKEIALMLYRQNELLTQAITLTDDAKLGVYTYNIYHFFKVERQEYGFFAAIPAGISLGTKTLVSYVKQFKLVFTKEGARSLGGFGTISNLFSKTWNWSHFWAMSAFLSIILAFMNILPIPAFDGGFLAFILYEMITRRTPSDKFLERAQRVGMALLVLLMVFANGNDILRWLGKM